MAKDPAVLWYWNDWSGGTVTLSRFLKGCYMDLLHAQFNNGSLSIEEIKTVLGSDFGSSWPALQKKFKIDEKGLFFNERLVFESDKRKKFSNGRRENLKGKPHMGSHMENENEFININLKNKFSEFLDFRLKIKKPVVDASKEALIKKLNKLSNNNDNNAIDILDQSIANGWQGIFELKKENGKSNSNIEAVRNF